MSRIAIRVDASVSIGSGHLVRCATLADCLRERGVESVFVCRELPPDYSDLLEKRGHIVKRIRSTHDGLRQEEDAASTLAILEQWPPVDVLVVDHYGLDADWEKHLRPAVHRILVIDDLIDRPHDCDFLLNQNFRADSGNPYASLIPAEARLLMGPRYALLRPQFAAARKKIKERTGAVRRVFVCFGGADQENYSAAVLSVLQPHASQLDRIDIVLGHTNPHYEDIVSRSSVLPNAVVHRQVNDIAELLGEADLAIGAGGSMNWERACLGVPTIAFGIVMNQKQVLAALIEYGVVLGDPAMAVPDPGVISSWLECSIGNAALLRGLSRRSLDLVDGQGVQRVANILLPPRIEFRHATLDDTGAIYSWRNDPAVRSVSLDNDEISFSGHQKWMQDTLRDPARMLLIAECGGHPVGVIRFDLKDSQATISLYSTPARVHQRNGLVQSATQWLCRQNPEIERIVAQVLPENTASLAAFRKAGYQDMQYVLVYEINS